MFNVPVTFLPTPPFTNERSQRAYIYHEYASNGAKHVVLTDTLINMMLKDDMVMPEILMQLHNEGLDFVDAHAPFGKFLDLSCPLKEYRPQMLAIQKRVLEICAMFSVHTITFHVGNNVGYKPEYLPLEYNRAMVEDTLSHLLPIAESLDITICIENIWFQTNTPEELLRYKSLFPTDALGFCYDAGHANLMSTRHGADRPALEHFQRDNHIDIPFDDHILEKMLPHIVNCHLHDNHGIWDEHLNIGQGNIDWQRIIPILKTAPRLKCIQSEVLGQSRIIGIKDVVDKFNWLATLE